MDIARGTRREPAGWSGGQVGRRLHRLGEQAGSALGATARLQIDLPPGAAACRSTPTTCAGCWSTCWTTRCATPATRRARSASLDRRDGRRSHAQLWSDGAADPAGRRAPPVRALLLPRAAPAAWACTSAANCASATARASTTGARAGRQRAAGNEFFVSFRARPLRRRAGCAASFDTIPPDATTAAPAQLWSSTTNPTCAPCTSSRCCARAIASMPPARWPRPGAAEGPAIRRRDHRHAAARRPGAGTAASHAGAAARASAASS